MSGLLEKIDSLSISRRHFVEAAAATGVVASLGLTGCDNTLSEDSSAQTVSEADGKWVPFNCMVGNCANRCYNRAYVVDGVIIRQGSDATHPDSEDYPQVRGCVKGRSNRRILTSAERLKYPMKRKNWQPGGGENSNGQLRGIDEWERISWDDAITYIVDELTRIRDTYGNKALLGTGQMDNRIGTGFLGSGALNLFGGCLTTWGQASVGGFSVTSIMMRGHWSLGAADAQDRMALRHAKLIVFWSFNPAWSASGSDMYNFITAKRKSGAKVIVVDPFFSPSAQALADQWVPCRPGTDGALLEAIAYEMITHDWQDQDFLDRCCVGFDADHMPEDAKTDENFKDYILGEYDGVPKTPEWASKICGTAPEVIRDLAEQMATVKPMALKAGQAAARTYYGNRFAQLFLTVGWMTGNVGILGGEVAAGGGLGTSHFGVRDGKNLVKLGGAGFAYPTNPICTETRAGGLLGYGIYNPEQEYGLPFAAVWKSIVDGEYRVPGPTGETKPCDIKCIYRDNYHGPACQFSGGYWFEQAFRKVEFVVTYDLFLTNDARYSDIVLPVQSPLEEEFSATGGMCPHEFVMFGSRVIEPYYECKTDPEIFFMIADKLGISEEELPRMSTKQGEFNKLANATVMKDDGVTYEPLVTITEEDLETYGVTGKPQQGRMPLGEFLEQGCYQVERKDGDNFMNVFGEAFRNDPEGNPVATTSGKYEIYCQKLKDYYDVACFHDIDALPKYKPAVDGYEQALEDQTYPFQLVALHHMRQGHSMMSNVKQLNEVFPNDLLMSEYDANRLGFTRGDWVLVSVAEGGSLARRVNPIPNLMPGVVAMGQGNWRDIDQDTGIDVGANLNTITRSLLVGDGYQAYNTVLVKIEPYSGPALQPDYLRDPLVPLAE